MNRFINFVMIALIALPLAACSKKNDKRDSIRVGRTARGGAAIMPGMNPGIPGVSQQQPGAPFAPTGNRVWGAIYAGQLLSEAEFNYNVHDFVAATINPNQLGYVSGDLNASTGIRFWGYVETTSGAFNPTSGMSTQIRPQTAELRIVIWDSFAGQVDTSGELITEYPVHIRGNAQGQISGNRAIIRFQDQYGWVEFNGTFDQQYFQGTVWFDNTGGYANYLGMFYVPTCSFFRCY